MGGYTREDCKIENCGVIAKEIPAPGKKESVPP